MLDSDQIGVDDREVMVEDVVVTEPRKAVFPVDNIRKIDIAQYYDTISYLMLPHIKDRPLLLEHYPDGISKRGSMQKDFGGVFPDYVQTVPLLGAGHSEKRPMLLSQNSKTLIYLTDLDHLAYHGWLSRFDKPELPDKMVIALDPPDVTYFEETVEVAFLLKSLLEEVNMCPFVMSTGASGLHIVCPLRRNRPFERVGAFLAEIRRRAVEARPELATAEANREKRGERIHLDLSMNIYGASSIIPYSVRAMEHAPIAIPLSWDELESSDMHPQRFNVGNIADRLEKKGDVWENFFRHKRKLAK